MRDAASRLTDLTKARWLDSGSAARYLGLRETAFIRLVKAGKIPVPSYILGPRLPRWDRETLDVTMIGTNAPTAQREPLQEAVEAILEERATKARHKKMMEAWRDKRQTPRVGDG